MNKEKPEVLKGHEYSYDEFDNGKILEGKKKDKLPPMGWNSWNAFGTGNTEALTKQMADCLVKLSLDKKGYRYVILDDGCYEPKRVNGKLANEHVKFPSGFESLSDYIHSKGLKFGMYNDIGTKLCSGTEVGTFGFEEQDAKSYIEWGIDFIKVDNCYYMWDDATFSDKSNYKYVYTPIIEKAVIRKNGKEFLCATCDEKKGFGTADGTGPQSSPTEPLCREFEIDVQALQAGEYELEIECVYKEEAEVGKWIQVAIGRGEKSNLIFDDFAADDENTPDRFTVSVPLILTDKDGVIRIMNHRRSENTLASYSTFLSALNKAKSNHDITYSVCEWGKTQPHNWAYKVGDSWRILNDITFNVGSDGDNGKASWEDDYTNSVCTQYNKCVIMDEYAGLKRGWNDPDMLVVGMDGLNLTQYRTHMVMWCMMNSPLMLGLDLRRVEIGDDIYKIIANDELIALNQDALGVQAKRVRVISKKSEYTNVDKTYIRDNDRVDILVKPLADEAVAVSIINLSSHIWDEKISISFDEIRPAVIGCYADAKILDEDSDYIAYDVITGSINAIDNREVSVERLDAYDSLTVRIMRRVTD